MEGTNGPFGIPLSADAVRSGSVGILRGPANLVEMSGID
jgi:hypothetical protein